MNLQPGTNTPVLGDTQWSTTEEQNYVKKGANYGWPCYEGSPRQPIYAADPATKPSCDSLYSQGVSAVQNPMYEYDRTGVGSAAIGGAFYTGDKYPVAYQNTWFFGDYAQEWLRYLKVDTTGVVTVPTASFADQIPVYVGMQMGPDGYLYYASLTTGNIYRIIYQNMQSGCTPTQFTISYYTGKTPGGTPLTTACSDAVNYNWAYNAPADGVPADDFSASYVTTRTFEDITYDFKITGDDGVRLLIDNQPVPALDHWVDQGATTYTAPVKLTAGQHTIRLEYYEATGTAQVALDWAKSVQNAPAATITTPADGTKVAPGATVTFSGSATDAEDGALPVSALAWDWTLKHCADIALTDCHYHPLGTATGASGNFVFPEHGTHDIYYVELNLKATDSSGLVSTKQYKLYPEHHETTSPCTADQFKVDYFANKTLSGIATASACTDSIDYDWGYGTPVSSIQADGFSARYTTTRTFAAGAYRFTLSSDDGSRVSIDGQPVVTLDQWNDHSLTTHTAEVTLSAGSHTITLEYYEATGKAQLQFGYVEASRAPLPPPASGWRGEYWNTPSTGPIPAFPTTPATLTRTDTSIDFTWEYGSPATTINGDKFMARWTGQVNFPTAGTYKVTTYADDGIRVKVNGIAVLNQWNDQSVATREATFSISQSGNAEVVVEYYENGGTATAKVVFAPISTTPLPPSTGCAAGQFKADYFRGMTLSGIPLTTACIDTVDYDWAYGSPTAVPADNFSARYSATRAYSAGTRTLTITGDDGVRLYIDGQLVINGWRDQGSTTYRTDYAFTAGEHTLTLEYYENTGTADVSLSISDTSVAASVPTNGWKAEYWNTSAGSQPAFPSATPTLTRQETSINYKWNYGSPAATISADHFLARWTGTFDLSPGTYQMRTTADDGVRIKLNGATVLDNWVDQGPTTTAGAFTLTSAGVHTVIMEYYENTGTATAIFELVKLN